MPNKTKPQGNSSISVSRRQMWKPILGVLLVCILAIAATPIVLIGIAEKEIQKGQPDEALRHLGQARLFHLFAGKIEFLRAQCFRRLGRAVEFRASLELAHKRGFPADILEREQVLFLAQAGQLQGIETKLADIFEKADEDSNDACEAYANGLLINMRQQEALNVVEHWAQDYPNDPRPECVRGKILQSLNRTKLAEEAFKKAATIDPDAPEIQKLLGDHLLETRHLDEAGKIFQTLTKHAKFHDLALLNLSKVERLRGNLKASKAAFKKILAPEQFSNGEYQLQAGLLAVDEQDFQTAETILKAVSVEHPRLLEAQNALATALRALGRIDEANSQAKRVAMAEEQLTLSTRLYDDVVAHPNDPAPRIRIGQIQLEFGQEQKGIAWLQSALNLQPGNLEALESMTQYYENLAEGKPQFADLAAHYRQQIEKNAKP